MISKNQAEENLAVIRSLMEKSNTYRAISAKTALIGGIAVLILTSIFQFLHPIPDYFPYGRPGISSMDAAPYQPDHGAMIDYAILYFFSWLILCTLLTLLNIVFLKSESGGTIISVFSSRLKNVLFDILPSVLCAGIISCLIMYPVIFRHGIEFSAAQALLSLTTIPFIWCFFYGFALLSTRNYSPLSLVILGWCFLVATFFAPFFYMFGFFQSSYMLSPNTFMALTFGIFHIIYALCVWPRKSKTENISEII